MGFYPDVPRKRDTVGATDPAARWQLATVTVFTSYAQHCVVQVPATIATIAKVVGSPRVQMRMANLPISQRGRRCTGKTVAKALTTCRIEGTC